MDSLRDYLDLMKRRGLVLAIEEEVTKGDIPELTELLSPRGRIIHFGRVEGYGCGVIANLAPSHDALGAALGADDAYAFFREGIKKTEKKVHVEREGIETVEMTGRDLMSVLPILKYCEKDSAPFITAAIVSSRDPHTGVIGRGVHRMEYRGGNRLGVTLINPPLSDIAADYKSRGERMPLAVSIGVDPVLFLSMALKVAPTVDKLEVAGGLKGHGVKVVDSLGAGVDMPLSEFYLEGYVDQDDVRPDGPLGEISGYYMALDGTPTMVVERISFRPSPLYHALLPTGPEGDAYLTFVSRAHMEEGVKKLFPFVGEIVFVPRTFGSSVVVQVAPLERARVRNLLISLLGYPMVKKVVAVDGDVDPKNLTDVEWALITRCKADEDIIVVPGLQGQPIDTQAKQGMGITKIAFDATMQGKRIDERARVARGDRHHIERIVGGVE
ncbi:MAG: UbiD family decarboxylase domain-containing protein [Syntrophorhabdales bacterium]|jgi:UbiD family decarboxylase